MKRYGLGSMSYIDRQVDGEREHVSRSIDASASLGLAVQGCSKGAQTLLRLYPSVYVTATLHYTVAAAAEGCKRGLSSSIVVRRQVGRTKAASSLAQLVLDDCCSALSCFLLRPSSRINGNSSSHSCS